MSLASRALWPKSVKKATAISSKKNHFGDGEWISKPGLRGRLAQAFAAQAILAVERHRQPHVFFGAPAWS
jgi:hypothetical protein